MTSIDADSLFDEIRNRLDAEDVPAFFNRVVSDLIAPAHLSLFWGDRLLTLDKSAGFMEDPVFRAAFEAIVGSHVYDQYQGPQSIAWRLHTLVWAAKCGARVDGDFVECGVFKGDMAWLVSQSVDLPSSGKRFYLYDSFEGFSPVHSSPDDFPLAPEFLEFANGHYRQEGLYEHVVARFESAPNVRVVKGFLPESLEGNAPAQIAFMHVDLNSPAAEVAVLERLFERVSPGGMIVFDDYGWKLFRKQKDVEDEFMSSRGYDILELPSGQGLVVKR